MGLFKKKSISSKYINVKTGVGYKTKTYSVQVAGGGERDKQTDRQADRQERMREDFYTLLGFKYFLRFIIPFQFFFQAAMLTAQE